MAIDMNLYKGNWREHIKMTSGKEAWEATGVPAIARELGIRWGGDFLGKEKGDFVHFHKELLPIVQLKSMAAQQFGSDPKLWRGNELLIA